MRRRSMTGRVRRWAAVAVVLAACLAGCAAEPIGPAAPPVPVAAPTPAASPDVPAPVRVLQMNLCNSGIAGCYTGRSVAEAAGVVRAEAPDLVTLNEVCEDDMPILERALAEAVPGGGLTSAFQPHRDGRTGQDYRCRNGRLFGLGLLSRWPTVPGSATEAGVYPAQDAEDPEERAWVCLDVGPTGEPSAAVALCTTHLAYTKRDVARAQCGHLFGTVVARLRARDGAAPLVMGGDLNLGSGADPDLKACLPAGSALVDDGAAQHVVGTPEFTVDGSRTIALRETDHPGLLVALTRR